MKRATAERLCAALQASAPPGLTVATGDDAPGSGWVGMWHVKMEGAPKGPCLLTGDLADEDRVREAWEEYTTADDRGDPSGSGDAGPCATAE